MNRVLKLLCLAIVTLSMHSIIVRADTETREEPVKTYSLESGGYLSLENINGNVTVEGWKKNEVSIRAVKKGTSKNLDQIKIIVSVDEYDGKEWIDIETQYPTFASKSGSVDYTIQAPFDAILEDIELVNGDLKISGITGYLSLGTVNGTITASGMADNAWIETVNGEIDLSFAKMGKGQAVDAESVNGGITIQLPADADAHVSAETINGEMSNDFDLAIDKGEWIGSSMEGRCGSGAARISLETVNGSIAIKKH
jgi:DUF4097 and DUF4098 domain-containing protein YvlB